MNTYDEIVQAVLNGRLSSTIEEQIGEAIRLADTSVLSLSSSLDDTSDRSVPQQASPTGAPPVGVSGQAAEGSDSAAYLEAGRLSFEIDRLTRLVTQSGIDLTSGATSPSASTTRQSSPSEGSAVGSVLRTAGMVTGVGPLVAGLIGLFGSKTKEQDELLQPFSLPNSVAIEAGLDTQGNMTAISYSQSNLPRAVTSQQIAPTQVQINVQAMDSRSFLDHSDQIAQAVREAMLHSHGINDIVAEL